MTSTPTPITKETMDALSAVTPKHEQKQRPASTVTESAVGHSGNGVNGVPAATSMTNTPATQEHGRITQLRDSCDACANSKVKCTGGTICSRCQTKGIACMFSPRRKRGPAKRAIRDTALETLSSAAVAAGAATNGTGEGSGSANASSSNSTSIKRSRIGSISENTNASRKQQGDSGGSRASTKRNGQQEGEGSGDVNSFVPGSTTTTSATSESGLAALVHLQREQLALCRQQTADNHRFQAQLMTMLAVLAGQLAPGSGNDGTTVNPVPRI